jgi:hypothetical protein
MQSVFSRLYQPRVWAVRRDKEVDSEGKYDGQCRCTMEGHSVKRCCHVKAISVTYLEYAFVALVTQKAKRLRHFMLYLARPFLPYFWTFSHKGHDFKGKSY